MKTKQKVMGMENENISPGQIFDNIWEDANSQDVIPQPKPIWVDTIMKEMPSIRGKRILEVGCGTGIISMEITKKGANCTLLDISPFALKIAKKIFKNANQTADFYLGDLFQLPFSNDSFDVVWSAGVLEHFTPDNTIAGLEEMCRVCKHEGTVIVLVPSARALFYRMGKYVMEKRRIWLYGYERPILSLKWAAPPGWQCVREYTFDFESQMAFWPFRGRKFLQKSVRKMSRFPLLINLLTAVFGGYMLAAVFKNISGKQHA